MAKIRLTSPTFDASAQTITHASFSDVTLAGIQLIVNVTDNIIIYNFSDPYKGGSLAGDVLTLDFDTTSMADADELMVLVEDGVVYQTSIQTAVEKLDNIVQTEGAVYVQGDTAIVAGVRKDTSGPPTGVADGDVHPLVFNEEGRLKTSTQPAIYTPVTGTITANGQTVSADVSRASNIMFHVTGTFSTVNCTFEGSIDGGTTWFLVQAIRSSANTIETTTGNLSATPTYAWEASVNALTNFRVRATAYTSGTQTWRILPGAYATEPIPGAQASATQPVSGTVTATITAAAATIAKAEDAVAASGDTGVNNLGVRRDGVISTAPTSAAGDYSEMAVDNYGQLRVAVQGRTTNPTASGDGQGVIMLADKLGKQVVVGSIRDLKANQVTTITSSTSETTIATAVASTFLDLYGIIITNTSATAVNVAIKDATAGTTRFNIAVPAGDTRGFMLPEGGAMKQSAVNNNWTATCSASVASVVITALTVSNT